MTKAIPIAVVGVSALFPGSANAGGFWKDILAGRDLITDVPPTHWLIDDYYDPDPTAEDKTYCKRGAFLSPVEFSPMQFGIPPKTLESTDTAQLLALIVAQQVLEDAAQGDFQEMDRERISVILGVASATELVVHMASRLQRPLWRNALRQSGIPEDQVEQICQRIADHYVPWQESTFPGLLGNVVAGRIANRLDLGGTNCVVDAACASSLAALEIGLNELYVGQSDMVIAGGVDTLNDILMYMCFSKTTALSHSGDCRPFSADADGTMMGEGIGMVALKRLEDAERDNDRIYAVIQSIGSSSDGKAKSIYAPVSKGQAKALTRAYETAGYSPSTVELVEAHGTSTKAGDLAEFQGLDMAFTDESMGRPWCALGSVKSQIGHAKAAAGAAGLFKAVMALHHKILPPTIKVQQPNPKLNIESTPFYINTEARPWIRANTHPRRASVSSFGFGGTNFHVAMEEYTGKAPQAWRTRPFVDELLLLSADTPEALLARCEEYLETAKTPGILAFLAQETQRNWTHTAPARLALFANDEASLSAQLRQAIEHLAKKPQDALVSPRGPAYQYDATPGKIAFLFPGQGSQHLGMAAAWAMHFDQVRNVWDQIASLPVSSTDDTTRPFSLHEVTYPQPAFNDADRAAQSQRLTQTEWAQPAIGATSAGMLALLDAIGIQADCVGGHSYGEVTALYAAGVLDLEAFLQASRSRGESMAAASEIKGAMLAVKAPIEQVKEALASWQLPEDAVVIANHNSPQQVVLSGTPEGIDLAEERLKAMKISSARLQVSTAFHSPLVQGACDPFFQSLEALKFRKPKLPVYANATASEYPKTPSTIRKRLAEQLGESVRFVDEIEAMYESGVRTFIEVGPHAALTQLVSSCLEDRPHHAIALHHKSKDDIQQMWRALGQLAILGAPIDFAPMWAPYAPVIDPRTIVAPTFTIPIGGNNYNKPYPPPEGPTGIAPPNPPRPAQPQPATPQAIAPPAQPAAPLQLQQAAPSQTQASAAPFASSPKTQAPAWTNPTSRVAPTNTKSNGISHQMGATVTTKPGMNGMDHNTRNGPFPPAGQQMGQMAPPYAPQRAYAPAEQHSWVGAYQEMQRQTVEAHTCFQRMMADTHVAFLRSSETAFMGLTHMLTGDRMPAPQALPMPSASAPARLEAPRSQPTYAPAPTQAYTAAPAPSYPPPHANGNGNGMSAQAPQYQVPQYQAAAAPQPTYVPPVAAAPVAAPVAPPKAVAAPPAPVAVATPAKAAASEDVDLVAIMLEVVSEKTGYPTEMLELSMELESELGIDSIKRVEILSAMQERVPSLPEVDTAQMASLRTLEEIVNTMQSASDAAPAQEGAQTVPFDVGPIQRFALRSVEAIPTGLALSGLHSCQWVAVTPEHPSSHPIADALLEGLRHKGIDAHLETSISDAADGVIYLGGLGVVVGRDDAIERNREAFQVACAIAPRFHEAGGVFVTVQDTGGAWGLDNISESRAWLGGIGALTKTAGLEWPRASVKAIDLEQGSRTAQAIADDILHELFSGGPEIEVGRRADGRRTTLRSVATASQPDTQVVDKESVIVVSGGAKGVTAHTLIALAQQSKARFVLLGRSALSKESPDILGITDSTALKHAVLKAAKAAGESIKPKELADRVNRIESNREIRGTLQAIEDAGSQAIYLPIDIRDREALGHQLDDIRRNWGPITGIVHGAGVLADAWLHKKTPDQFERVFSTKIDGLCTLLDLTQQDPLKILCLFSSVSARVGNQGQSDYAMANEILNKVAAAEAQRRGGTCIVKSLDWGPWEGGMVTPQLKQLFEQRGIALIPLDTGARFMVEELQDNHGDCELVIGGAVSPEGLQGDSAEDKGTIVDAWVHQSTYPFLESHRVQGAPVLPVVLALEWFTRLAQACHPGQIVASCEDLKVLKGVRLTDFDHKGHLFHVSCRDTAPQQCVCTLESPDGTRHYSATITLAASLQAPHKMTQTNPTLAPSPWSHQELYADQTLFHGPDFQVIETLNGVAPEGGEAQLWGTAQKGWAGGPWSTDPAALDGSLQLALLWGLQQTKQQTLPMRIGRYIPYDNTAQIDPMRCLLRARKVSSLRTVSDLFLFGKDGHPIAELQEVEMITMPTIAPSAL